MKTPTFYYHNTSLKYLIKNTTHITVALDLVEIHHHMTIKPDLIIVFVGKIIAVAIMNYILFIFQSSVISFRAYKEMCSSHCTLLILAKPIVIAHSVNFGNTITVSKIVGLTSQFSTQNCLGCYSKLDLVSKFLTEVATHLSHIKLRTKYTMNIIL